MDEPNREFLQLRKRAEDAPDHETFAQILREMTAYFTREWERQERDHDRNTASDPAA